MENGAFSLAMQTNREAWKKGSNNCWIWHLERARKTHRSWPGPSLYWDRGAPAQLLTSLVCLDEPLGLTIPLLKREISLPFLPKAIIANVMPLLLL